MKTVKEEMKIKKKKQQKCPSCNSPCIHINCEWCVSYSLDDSYVNQLRQEMVEIFEFLKDKNQKYGSSIMEPLGIFHKGTTIEAIDARIDDKLARIKNQSSDEDAILDLIGYLLWRKVLNKIK